jgi:deoxyribonuclease V
MNSSEAIMLQRRLASQVSTRETDCSFRYVAGVDVSTSRWQREGTAAVIVLTYPELELLEEKRVQGQISFPYVPGLLSFREAPLILEAFRQLVFTPDLVIVDGQGLAHPRRFGIAAHLGLFLDIPTVGCAKSRLCGAYQEPGLKAGSSVDLIHDGDIIGQVVRTRTGIKPIYVSVGHKISLHQAVNWVLLCCRGYRLPEPTRLAHQAAGGQLRSSKAHLLV